MERLFALSILLILHTALYLKTIWFYVVIDDKECFKSCKGQKFSLLRHITSYQLQNLKLAHSLSFAFHFINCALMYFIFGIYPAILFCVNPFLTQGSVWLSGRSYALTTTLCLLATLYPVLTLVLYPLALKLLISAFPLIFVFLGTKFWWACLIFPLGVILSLKQIVGKFALSSDTSRRFKFRNFILFFKTLGYYFLNILLPFRMGVYHKFMSHYAVTKEDMDEAFKIDKFFFIGLIVAVGSILYFKNPIFYGLFWFVLFIAPWCNFITIAQGIAERYAYLPAVGLMVFLSKAVFLLPCGYLVFCLFFLYYTIRLFLYLEAYKDMRAYCDSQIRNFPDVSSGYTLKGSNLVEEGNEVGALQIWLEGFKIRENDFRLVNNISVALRKLGRLTEAETFLRHAGRIDLIDRNVEKNAIIERNLDAIAMVKIMRNEKSKNQFRNFLKRGIR